MKNKHNLQELPHFIELITDLVFVKNFKGQFTHFNEEFLKYIDKKREDVINKTDFELFDKEIAERFTNIDNEIIKSKKTRQDYEEKVVDKKGVISYFNTTKQILYDQDENEIGLFCIAKNITIRKEYELIYQDNQLLLEYIAIEKDLKIILDKIVSQAEHRNINSKCSILLLDSEKKHLLSCSAPSLPSFYVDAINGIEIGEKVGSCGSAAFKKQRVIVNDINTHENWQNYLELTNKANLHACWSQPILSSNNEILGTFAIYNSILKTPSNFELKLIAAYSNLAAIAIEKDKNYKIILENEYQLSLLFDNTQSGLIYVNNKREVVKANKRFANIFGYKTSEELIGENTLIFYESEGKHRNLQNKISLLLQDKKTFHIEYQFKKKDGSIIWCELSGKALHKISNNELAQGILWTINDISLRKSAEEQLQKSELLNKSILETIPNMLWAKDLDGKYIICNYEFEKYYNVKKEEIIGKTDYDFVTKKEADDFSYHDDLALKSLIPLTNESWITYPNDRKTVLLETTKKTLSDKDGNIVGTLGVAYDVTKRKEELEKVEKLNSLAASLAQSQKTLLSIFDKGDSVLFKWENNLSWDVKYVSDSVQHIMGYSKEDFLSNHLRYKDCIHKDDLKTVYNEVQYAIENNMDYFLHKPYRIIDNENNEKWVLDHTVVEKDSDNNIKYFIGYITDITEQLKQQDLLFQQSKLAAMGEMIGNIAHQWRQPLSIISSIATASKLEKELNILDDEVFLNNMNTINTNAQYLSQTIDDFREFIKTDRFLDDFNLSNAVKSFLNITNTSIVDNNIEIILDLEDDIIMNNYQNDMTQAFINIIYNSIDAFVEKEIEKRYFFIKTRKSENKITIKLKDNAGGIDHSLIKKIFEPYTTSKHKSLGTGLGLNITYNFIVVGMKGKISVENTTYEYENKEYTGCEFTVTFDNYFR